MSAVAGLLSSANIGTTNDLVGEFQETIFVRNSKGMNVGSTLFGLMAKLKTEPADNIEFNWFERDPVKRVVYVASNHADTGTDTSIVVTDTSGGAYSGITTVNTPFGELSLAFHPLLKEIPQLNGWMFVVDLPLLVQKVFEPLFLEPDIQLPGQDAYQEQYRAKLGLKLKFAQAFGVAQNLSSIVA